VEHEASSQQPEPTVTSAPTVSTKKPSRAVPRLRSIAAWFLVVVACLAIPLSVVTFWATRTISDKDQFVSTLSPLATNPTVVSAISQHITDEITKEIQAHPRLDGPVLTALEPKLRAQVNQAVESHRFAVVWAKALGATHAVLITALDGRGNPHSHLVINLKPMAKDAVKRLDAKGITQFDQLVNGPGAAPIQIKVTSIKDLQKIHGAYHLLKTIEWVLPLVGLLAIVGAVLLAPRRRRVVMGLGIGVGLISILTLVGLAVGHDVVTSAIHGGSTKKSAAGAAYDGLLRYLHTYFILLAIAALLALVATIATIVAGRQHKNTHSTSTPSSLVDA